MWVIIGAMLVLWLLCLILGVIFKVAAWFVLGAAIFLVLTVAFGVIHAIMSSHRP